MSMKKMQYNGYLTIILLLLIIIGLNIGLYCYIKANADELASEKGIGKKFMSTLFPFKGPYEQCEDQVCPDFTNKKECMQQNKDQIMSCCQGVCHAKCVHLPGPALKECLSACVPLFNA